VRPRNEYGSPRSPQVVILSRTRCRGV
jgi:hypothetical protein